LQDLFIVEVGKLVYVHFQKNFPQIYPIYFSFNIKYLEETSEAWKIQTYYTSITKHPDYNGAIWNEIPVPYKIQNFSFNLFKYK